MQSRLLPQPRATGAKPRRTATNKEIPPYFRAAITPSDGKHPPLPQMPYAVSG